MSIGREREAASPLPLEKKVFSCERATDGAADCLSLWLVVCTALPLVHAFRLLLLLTAGPVRSSIYSYIYTCIVHVISYIRVV